MFSAGFSLLLKEYRSRVGKITQSELKDMLDELGYNVDVSTISKYETGDRTPSVDYIVYFSEALGLSDEDERTLLDVYIQDNAYDQISLFQDVKLNRKRGRR